MHIFKRIPDLIAFTCHSACSDGAKLPLARGWRFRVSVNGAEKKLMDARAGRILLRFARTKPSGFFSAACIRWLACSTLA